MDCGGLWKVESMRLWKINIVGLWDFEMGSKACGVEVGQRKLCTDWFSQEAESDVAK